jgi:hypothetical protein
VEAAQQFVDVGTPSLGELQVDAVAIEQHTGKAVRFIPGAGVLEQFEQIALRQAGGRETGINQKGE